MLYFFVHFWPWKTIPLCVCTTVRDLSTCFWRDISWFRFWAITNKLFQTSVDNSLYGHILSFLFKKHPSVKAGLYGSCMFIFLRNGHLCHFTFPRVVCISSSVLSHSCQHLVSSIFIIIIKICGGISLWS